MKKIINCLLLCFMISLANMVHTANVANKLKSSVKTSIKDKSTSHAEEPSFAQKTFALMQKLHDDSADADPESHVDYEEAGIDLIKQLLNHYKEHLQSGTFPGDSIHEHNETETDENENQGSNLREMIKTLEKVLKEKTDNIKTMKQEAQSHVENVASATKQNSEREIGIQKIHEQNDEIRQKFNYTAGEMEFEDFANDGQEIDNSEQFRNETGTTENTENTENTEETDIAFLQGDTGAQHGTKIAKACTAGFFGVIPPSFAYKKHADFGNSDFYAHGYHRQGALYYKNCKSGYTNVLGICWQSCGSHYTDFGATCTRCHWRTCGGWFKYPCLKCHTYGKHTYGTHIITLFDSRVKCRGSDRYKGGALCYRNCGRQNDGLENCGIGACASSTGACLAGVLTMIAELLIGMATFVAFVASFGATGAGGTQATVAGARALLKQAGTKATKAFQFAKKIANNSTFRETMKKRAVEAAKKKFKEDAGYFARDKYIELQCRRVADGILDKTQTTNSFDIKSLDMTGISTAAVTCNDESKQDVECAKAIMAVLSTVDPTGLCAIAGALMQPSIDR